MKYIFRALTPQLQRDLESDRSILLLGPRQTGKTTLLSRFPAQLSISLLDHRIRLNYERDPQVLADEVDHLPGTPTVIIDEIEKLPVLMDTIQYLIDQRKARFILTGSSARKLRRRHAMNLLPGRIAIHRLDPFIMTEYPTQPNLENCLYFGDLPRTILAKQKEALLRDYVSLYLEEEIRAEAVVRNTGLFAQFLELAAIESGNIINFSSIAQDLGVSAKTVQSYFEILDDCLVAERVLPYWDKKTRKSLYKGYKYLLFDMGVRRVAAREGTPLPLDRLGHVFEQWIGLQLIRLCRLLGSNAQIKYWRDHNGPEVDWIIDLHHRLIPIEVKWTDRPSIKDCHHLHTFQQRYPIAEHGYIVCRISAPRKLSETVTALPWIQLCEWIRPKIERPAD